MKKILIICSLDKYANSIRPNEMKKFLEKHGHEVILLDTIFLHRLKVKNGKLSVNKISIISFNHLLLHVIVRVGNLLDMFPNFIFKHVYYFYFMFSVSIRSRLLVKLVDQLNIDLLIVKNAEDTTLVLFEREYKILYDSPTPFSDEIYYGNKISAFFYKKLLNWEKEIYKKADYLSFHHESYYKYVTKYIYDGSNLINIKGGCSISREKVLFSNPLKIVYIGGLGGYWINLPLLAKLSKQYPIDIYGAPTPPKKLGLNYKGYAKPDVLKDYQLGLITVTKDKLRAEGFSAKHMEYLSWGLPVLVPDWRISAKYLKGSIFYNEDNFLDVVKKYSKKNEWEKMSNFARNEANKHNWNVVLKPLLKIIKD